jgi:hypothetical protein
MVISGPGAPEAAVMPAASVATIQDARAARPASLRQAGSVMGHPMLRRAGRF